MGIIEWFSMSNEEKALAKEKRKKQKMANNEIYSLIHSTGLSDDQYEQVKKLIEDGGDINLAGWQKGYEGSTLLHLAAINGCAKIVSYLINNGADVNVASTSINNTPLIAATQFERVEVVRLLLNGGADTSIMMSFGDDCYFPQLRGVRLTALAIASQKGNHEIVKLLTEHGARE